MKINFKMVLHLSFIVSTVSCSPSSFDYGIEKEEGSSINQYSDGLDTTFIGDDTTKTGEVAQTAIGDSKTALKNCAWSLQTKQSSSFTITNLPGLLGAGKIDSKPVYALAEVGKGRVVFSGDTNLVGLSDQSCPVWPWAGATFPKTPRVLVFGRSTCNQDKEFYGNGIYKYPGVYQPGLQLPAKYLNNPSALKQDFDLVVYCSNAQSSNLNVISTLTQYVRNLGGGLYLAHEYYPYVGDADFAAMNALSEPMGVRFDKTSIQWSSVGLAIQFE